MQDHGNEPFRPTVLVVDDDSQVRELIRRVLERSGCDVHTFGYGGAALQWAAAWPEPLHLLIADLVLEDLSGLEVARRLNDLRSVPLLLTSGYAEGTVEVPQGVRFLQKPFDLTELLQAVRDLLAT